MSSITNKMDSVFAGSMENDSEFDVLFDQEDSLIDTVVGCNESGDPLTGVDFEDLHQTDDNADPDDVRDVESDDNAMGAPNPEGVKKTELDDTSVKGEENKDSDADKFFDDCDKKYQDDKEKEIKADPEHLYDALDKVGENVEMLEAELAREAAEDDDLTDEDLLDEAFDMDTFDFFTEACHKENGDEDENCPECGKNPCECAKHESGNFVDSLEEEIAKEAKDKTIELENEAAGIDSDIAAIDSSDMDDDDELLDAVVGKTRSASSREKYAYDYSDEELIDMAINSK